MRKLTPEEIKRPIQNSEKPVSSQPTGPLHMLWYFNSVSQFSHTVMSDFLGPHGLQHARLAFPSPTPGACSNPCPSIWWYHQTISSSVVPFSSCLQSFPASGSFPMSPFFPLGGQSIGASASASVLTMNIQDWFPLGLTGWIFQFHGFRHHLQWFWSPRK